MIAYLCCGRTLTRVFPQAKIALSEQIVLGAGVLALIMLTLTLPGKISLRFISLLTLTLPVLLYLITFGPASLREMDWKRPVETPCPELIVLGTLIILPALILLGVPVYMGDELGHWALIVKEMIRYDDLPRGTHLSASQFGSYPLLGPLLTVSGLSLYGDMHEGAGRVIMFLMTLIGSFFVYERLKTRYSTSSSILAATAAHFLFFLPGFKWYTSWYPEGPFAVVLLISSYQLVTTFSKPDPPSWSSIATLSLSLMLLVALRPDGFLFLPLDLLIGTLLLVGWRTDLRAKSVRFAVSFLGPCVLVAIWRTYSLLNQFPALRWGIVNPINPPSMVASAILQRLVEPSQLSPLTTGVLVAIVLTLLTFNRLDSEEKAFLSLLLVPVYKLLLLFVTYVLTFSSSEAAQAAGFERYMLQTSLTTFFVLAFLGLKFLEVRQIPIGKNAAYYAIAAAIMLHFGIASLLWAAVSPDDNYRVKDLVANLKEKSPDLSPIQVLCQNCTDYLPGLITYYATPDIVIKGQYSIGRPVTGSQYLNVKREETGIQSRTEYLDFLHELGIQGILVLESDSELERVMEVELSAEKVYLFHVTEHDFEYQWSMQKPTFDTPEGPSLRRRVRAIWNELSELFHR